MPQCSRRRGETGGVGVGRGRGLVGRGKGEGETGNGRGLFLLRYNKKNWREKCGIAYILTLLFYWIRIFIGNVIPIKRRETIGSITRRCSGKWARTLPPHLRGGSKTGPGRRRKSSLTRNLVFQSHFLSCQEQIREIIRWTFICANQTDQESSPDILSFSPSSPFPFDACPAS